MTRHFLPPAIQETAAATILVEAIRCWRQARDGGESVMPCLARLISCDDSTILAPVLDSLIRLYEDALGRPVAVGYDMALSADELLLLALLDGTGSRACLGCSRKVGHTLDCALWSTRIVFAMTCDPATSRLR